MDEIQQCWERKDCTSKWQWRKKELALMSATKQNIYFHPTYTQPKTNQLSSRQYKQALSSNMALLYRGKSKLGSEQTQQEKPFFLLRILHYCFYRFCVFYTSGNIRFYTTYYTLCSVHFMDFMLSSYFLLVLKIVWF